MLPSDSMYSYISMLPSDSINFSFVYMAKVILCIVYRMYSIQ